MTDGAPRVPTTGWPDGNNSDQLHVLSGERFTPFDRVPLPQEDPTTTPHSTSSVPATAPVSMAHLEQYTDGDWVEPTDELVGTAVFDATGDKAAMPSWDELVRQHADRVNRLAYRLSGNQHDAEDLTQETFIRVFRSLQNYQPGTYERS
ncbi:sigma factor, partial [Mycolicibacterium sp.]|uniref:sigma factor n=1 Tax=Mycolicibacterium sp. TaxID=2320850 RepID=UPI003D0EEBFE